VDPAMSKVLYRPLSIVISVLGGILAGAIFKQIWQGARTAGSRSSRRSNPFGLGGLTDDGFISLDEHSPSASFPAVPSCVLASPGQHRAAGHQSGWRNHGKSQHHP
jgi:hypothetical protein